MGLAGLLRWSLPSQSSFFFLLTPISHEVVRLELKVALADIDEEKLKAVGKDVAAVVGEANVLVVPTDVAKLEEVVRLRGQGSMSSGVR